MDLYDFSGPFHTLPQYGTLDHDFTEMKIPEC